MFKIKEERGDATPMFMVGTVLGSIYAPEVHRDVMYFIEWADKPGVAVGVIGWKITPRSLQ